MRWATIPLPVGVKKATSAPSRIVRERPQARRLPPRVQDNAMTDPDRAARVRQGSRVSAEPRARRASNAIDRPR